MQQREEIWVFWVHAGTRARVEEGFKAVADAAKIPGRNQPKVDILQLVYQWLNNELHGQWLMVLDSVDDINIFYGTEEKGKRTATAAEEKRALWTYLPQSPNGSILITTRNKELAFRLTGSWSNIIEVGPMDHDHALALITTKLGGQSDVDAATGLAEALEYMPLAISQAAAYIQQRAPRTSVRKYLEEFRKSERKKSSLLNHDVGDLRRDGSASNSVITTWQISFDYIRSKRPSATDLLSLMSFFDRQGILEALVRPMDQDESCNSKSNSDNESIGSSETSNSAFEENIATLRNYCLVGINETGDVFEMHGLVQLSTRKWLDVHKETEKFKTQYISRMAQAFPTGNFENWRACQMLFPHAEKATDYHPIDKESLKEWALLLDNAGWYSRGQGRYAIAEMMLKMSQDTRKTVLGPDHPNTLTSMSNLASTYWNQGRWKEAESLGLQVMEASKTVLGPDHPNTLTSMGNLASTYWNQGRLKEAESLGVQVMEASKTVLGPDHRDTLTSMGNLASIYWDQGRWKEAESLELQVIEASKTVLEPDHRDTLTSIGNLASTYWDQGRWKEAESLELQVMETSKTVLGPDHPNTLTSMGNLASTY
jgi:tetratricopeptide (TPR) repeat protein